jgi:hypothetical protein
LFCSGLFVVAGGKEQTGDEEKGDDFFHDQF